MAWCKRFKSWVRGISTKKRILVQRRPPRESSNIDDDEIAELIAIEII